LPAPFHDGTASLEEGAAILQAAHANLSGDVGAAMKAARRALVQNPDDSTPGRAVASVHLGMAAYYASELTAAETAFDQVLRSRPGDEWASVIVTALGNLAAVQLDGGKLVRAEETAAEAERAIDGFGVHEAPFTCRFWLARGKLLERRGEVADAEAAYERAVALARRITSRLVVAHGLLALAMLKRRRGAYGEARALARQAREVLAVCPDPGMLGKLLVQTERALQLAPAGDAETTLPVEADLSAMELAVLRLLGSELSQREIAAELYISLNTVKAHTRSIFRKLGVSSRDEAVARGRARTLL
jgi:LuxR family maltose regulon positive regulatory protein